MKRPRDDSQPQSFVAAFAQRRQTAPVSATRTRLEQCRANCVLLRADLDELRADRDRLYDALEVGIIAVNERRTPAELSRDDALMRTAIALSGRLVK